MFNFENRKVNPKVVEIMSDSLLSANEKAIRIVTTLSVNPLYNKGAARYQFVKDIRSYVRDTSPRNLERIATVTDSDFTALLQ